MTVVLNAAPRVLVCPDSYKECAPSVQVATVMSEAGREASSALDPQAPFGEATYIECPLGDGGEGTLDALLRSSGMEAVQLVVPNALGEPTAARLGWNADQSWALVESAQALGLGLIPRGERNIWQAHSFGLGMMVTEALDMGATRITLAMGGSATNDGGAGMLSALGAHFFDRVGREIPPFPGGTASLAAVDLRDLDPRIRETEFEVALDVDNPLLGPEGATAIFAPQKGASTQDIPRLDGILKRFARAVEAAQRFAAKSMGEGGGASGNAPTSWIDAPGAGAAGGLGWASMAVLGAAPKRGADLVAEILNVGDAMEDADIVFTGEGRLDGQTLSGKTVNKVLELSTAKGIPAVVFAGSLGPGWEAVAALPQVSVVLTTEEGLASEAALENCLENIGEAVAHYVRSQR